MKILLALGLYILAIDDTLGQVLYGMTSSGGQYGYGTIFKYDVVADSFTKIYDFDGVNGSNPSAALTQGQNGRLYGGTFNGGMYSGGVIFQYDPVTNIYTKKYDFDLGGQPHGSMVKFTDGRFYGTTFTGNNLYSVGSIFSYDPASDSVSFLHAFGNGNDGFYPLSGLTIFNDKLYGNTSVGTGNDGVVFSYDPASGNYSNTPFDSNGIDGNYLRGDLITLNGNLYGMAVGGGAHHGGTIYEYNVSDSAIIVKYSLDSNSLPYGKLLFGEDGKLYGMTQGNSPSVKPTLFQYDTALNILTVLHTFDSIPLDGSVPLGGLMQASNGLLYGMTEIGGSNNLGTIFSYDYSNHIYTKLKDLDSATTGTLPYGDLMEINPTLGIPIPIKSDNNIALYPNPSKSSITLSASDIITDVVISDLTGRIVFALSCHINQTAIDISYLSAGVYLVKINNTKVIKLVKED